MALTSGASADSLVTLISATPPSNAIQSDGPIRIHLADRLQMLTQRVAASSCALTSDVAIQESRETLRTAELEFDMIIRALKDGDPDLHILKPETNRRTLHDIDLVWEEWSVTREAIEAVLANGHDVDSAHVIDDHNLKLLETAAQLSTDINGQYAHPFEISQADAMAIRIAGRTRMLTQQMAKDSCEIWTAYNKEAAREDLVKVMHLFESSMIALRDGMPSVGIKPAPTEEILADLNSILSRWDIIKTNQQILLEGGSLEMDQKYEIFHDLNIELDEIDKLVLHYVDYAARHH